MDSIIEEFARRVLDWQHREIARADLIRYAAHLRGIVQPQLDELDALKAASMTKRPKVSA